MAIREARSNLSTVRSAKPLIRTPASSGKALSSDHFKSVLRCAQMLLAPQSKIRLHRRAQCIDVAVGMSACQHIAPLAQRIEEFILEILHPKRLVAFSRAAFVREKQILRDGVGLVPGI